MTVINTFATEVKPIWCGGCGNFSLFHSITREILPGLGISRHETMIVSGIGCSSRITSYIDTYGINSVHGRAVTIAQGAKLAKPELTVLAIGGDGDFFSIGAGHLPHAVRRNPDITCIMLNNFVYALTKGQVSPTTPLQRRGESDFMGKETYPPVDPLLDMVSFSVSTGSSFIAQGIANNIPHLSQLIKEGINHKGFSFISVISPCITFDPPELFGTIKKNARYLKEGEMIELPASANYEPWPHDPTDIVQALKLARTSFMEAPHLGVFFRGQQNPE